MITENTIVRTPRLNSKATLIVDIDGTLLYQDNVLFDKEYNLLGNDPHYPNGRKLPGVEQLSMFHRKGHKIFLLTGRPETYRDITEKQLKDLGIYYDKLIMDAGTGIRILVNDSKPYSSLPTACGITVRSNSGIESIKIEEGID